MAYERVKPTYTLLWTFVQLSVVSTNLHPNILLSTLLSTSPILSTAQEINKFHIHMTQEKLQQIQTFFD
jgi:hypothetical protein